MSSSSNSQAVLYVPVDQLEFTVADIPAMLAEARWPHIQGQRVAYALRLDAPQTRGKPFTSEDLAVLSDIWRDATLPEPRFPMPLDTWGRYVAAFDQSKRKPNWGLWQCLQDAALDNGIRRVAAQSGYESSLREAIRGGEISARDPLTGRPVSPSDVRAQFNPDHLVLSRDDLVRFAADSLIEVRTQGDEPGDSGAVSSPDSGPAGTSECGVQGVQQRADAISREIEAVIAEIRAHDTRALITTHTVMNHLFKRVGSPESCICELIADGQGIVWRNDDGQPMPLTKSSLRKRLERRSRVQPGR